MVDDFLDAKKASVSSDEYSNFRKILPPNFQMVNAVIPDGDTMLVPEGACQVRLVGSPFLAEMRTMADKATTGPLQESRLLASPIFLRSLGITGMGGKVYKETLRSLCGHVFLIFTK